VIPLIVYRVYADGRPDELVRGVDIVGTPLSSFSRIVATSDKLDVFNGYCGAESGSVPVSAVSPALLVSDIEIQKKRPFTGPSALTRPPGKNPMKRIVCGRLVTCGRLVIGLSLGKLHRTRRLTIGGRMPSCPTYRFLALCLCLAVTAFSQDDVILRAMKDELERSRQLRIVSLDAPYFFEYRVEDASVYTAAATLGALIGTNTSALRIPVVKVRVGDYAFDNTNHIYSDFYAGSRYDSNQLPLENDYMALRQVLWLATDRSYKTAADAIARKRASMKNMNLPEQLPDFSKAPPIQALLPIHRVPYSEAQWKDRVVKLSGVFAGYPKILSSGVDIQISESTDYLVNSEGTTLRFPEDLAFLRIRAVGLAADGASVRDAEVIQSFEVTGLPSEVELRRQATEVANNVTALTQAPAGEAYTGPVMFESRAAAQLFGQLLGDNLKITRKPIAEPGRPAPYLPSELENRIGSRVLPEWMDVVDDPTQTEFHGHTLFGHYLYDMEGIAPKPLTLVEKGMLKTFALTRSPVVKGFESSNGRGRMPGAFGHNGPGFGNLFIRASQTTPATDSQEEAD